MCRRRHSWATRLLRRRSLPWVLPSGAGQAVRRVRVPEQQAARPRRHRRHPLMKGLICWTPFSLAAGACMWTPRPSRWPPRLASATCWHPRTWWPMALQVHQTRPAQLQAAVRPRPPHRCRCRLWRPLPRPQALAATQRCRLHLPLPRPLSPQVLTPVRQCRRRRLYLHQLQLPRVRLHEARQAYFCAAPMCPPCTPWQPHARGQPCNKVWPVFQICAQPCHRTGTGVSSCRHPTDKGRRRAPVRAQETEFTLQVRERLSDDSSRAGLVATAEQVHDRHKDGWRHGRRWGGRRWW